MSPTLLGIRAVHPVVGGGYTGPTIVGSAITKSSNASGTLAITKAEYDAQGATTNDYLFGSGYQYYDKFNSPNLLMQWSSGSPSSVGAGILGFTGQDTSNHANPLSGAVYESTLASNAAVINGVYGALLAGFIVRGATVTGTVWRANYSTTPISAVGVATHNDSGGSLVSSITPLSSMNFTANRLMLVLACCVGSRTVTSWAAGVTQLAVFSSSGGGGSEGPYTMAIGYKQMTANETSSPGVTWSSSAASILQVWEMK